MSAFYIPITGKANRIEKDTVERHKMGDKEVDRKKE